MNKRKLILGSTSKPRKMLLERLQIPFETADPDVDETPLPDETVEQMVCRLAEEKARAVAKSYPEAVIIGADQVGTLDGQILGKPLTHENAVRQLQQMSDRTVRFCSGICVFDAQRQIIQVSMETMDVVFRPLTLDMIEHYLRKEQPYHCAGSAKMEGLGIALISELRGKDYTSLIGLPLILLTQMLEQVNLGPLEVAF